MAPLPVADARQALVEALSAVVGWVGSLTDEQLLAASRCRGWAVCDVLCHLHIGAQEVLVGLSSRTDAPADTDLVSYWHGERGGGAGELAHARFIRLVASAYREPSGLVAHFTTTGEAAMRRAADVEEGWRLHWQGRVLPVGDFLATWAVEVAIHLLDMGKELEAPPVPPSALRLVRRTFDGLLGAPEPVGWADREYALKGSGREPLIASEVALLGERAGGFPLLG